MKISQKVIVFSEKTHETRGFYRTNMTKLSNYIYQYSISDIELQGLIIFYGCSSKNSNLS